MLVSTSLVHLFNSNDISNIQKYESKHKRIRELMHISEKEAQLQQNVAVDALLHKNTKECNKKKDIRRLKNRLSAIRSRARKEAEHLMNIERIHSLEAQVKMLDNFVSKNISKWSAVDDNSSTNTKKRKVSLQDQSSHVPENKVRRTNGFVAAGTISPSSSIMPEAYQKQLLSSMKIMNTLDTDDDPDDPDATNCMIKMRNDTTVPISFALPFSSSSFSSSSSSYCLPSTPLPPESFESFPLHNTINNTTSINDPDHSRLKGR